MKFTFGEKKRSEIEKEDNQELISDEDDLTKGFSEDEIRKHFNVLARCVAHAYIATAVIANEAGSDGAKTISPIGDLVYKSHMKHINKYLEPILTDSRLQRMIPLTRI